MYRVCTLRQAVIAQPLGRVGALADGCAGRAYALSGRVLQPHRGALGAVMRRVKLVAGREVGLHLERPSFREGELEMVDPPVHAAPPELVRHFLE